MFLFKFLHLSFLADTTSKCYLRLSWSGIIVYFTTRGGFWEELLKNRNTVPNAFFQKYFRKFCIVKDDRFVERKFNFEGLVNLIGNRPFQLKRQVITET